MTHPDRFYLAGVMGMPIMHSRSPMLHNYWLKQQGMAGTYVPLAIKPDGLAAALRALQPENPRWGFQVATSPFRTSKRPWPSWTR